MSTRRISGRWKTRLQANPSLTNSVSPDVYEGAIMYLAGMSYYKKVSDFDQVNAEPAQGQPAFNLGGGPVQNQRGAGQFRQSDQRAGRSRCCPTWTCSFTRRRWLATARCSRIPGRPLQLAQQNYNLMSIVNNSAEEHQIINRFYQQTNAVSTVRLLQLSQSSGAGIVPLNYQQLRRPGPDVIRARPLQNWDPGLWSQVVNALQNSPYTHRLHHAGADDQFGLRGHGGADSGLEPVAGVDLAGKLERRVRARHLPRHRCRRATRSTYDLNDDDDFTMTLTTPATGHHAGAQTDRRTELSEQPQSNPEQR